MADNRRRSRKSKLVPRNVQDIYDDETITGLQAKSEMDQPIVKMEIDSDDSHTQEDVQEDASLKFNIKVEVEEVDEDLTQDDDDIDLNKKETEVKQCFIEDTTIRKEIEELMKITTDPIDKQVEIGIRNYWGWDLDAVPEDNENEILLLKAITKWRIWKSGAPHRRETPFTYKCYICEKAWWHLSEFRDHINENHDCNSDKRITIKLEYNSNESNVIAFSGLRVQAKNFPIESDCWRCGMSFDEHVQRKRTQIFYYCNYCEDAYPTCTLLGYHESNCNKNNVIALNSKCNLCSYAFASQDRLENHMTSYHGVRSDLPTTTVVHICSLCKGKYFTTKLHKCLRGPMSETCVYCSRGFVNVLYAAVHLKMVYLMKGGMECNICKVLLLSPCMEVEHLVGHSPSYSLAYKCPKCPSILFLNKHSVEQHFLLHKDCVGKINFELIVVPKHRIQNHDEIKTEDKEANKSPAQETNSHDKGLRNGKCQRAQSIGDVIEGVQNKNVKVEEQIDLGIDYLENEIKQELMEYQECLSNVFKVSENFVRNQTEAIEDIQEASRVLEVKTEPVITEEYEDDIIILHSGEANVAPEDVETVENAENVGDSDVDAIKIADLEPETILTTSNKKSKLYKCKKCNYKGHHRKFREHLEHVETYGCTKCCKTFVDMRDYASHFVKHNINLLVCPQCGIWYENLFKLTVHLKAHVNQTYVKLKVLKDEADMGKSKTYQCRKCRQIVVKSSFFEHWEWHLNLSEALSQSPPQTGDEDEDVKVVVNPGAGMSPQMINKVLDILNPKTGIYNKFSQSFKQCCVCDRTFNRQNDCKRHLIEHLLQNAYMNYNVNDCLKCQLCHEGFEKPDRYKQHMRDHASLPIYKCELCDRSFSDSSNFTKHKKIHNFNALVCDICNKKFQIKETLVKHIKMHQVTEPYNCQECSKVFYMQSSFTRHMRQKHDTSLLKFGCSICKRKFATTKEKCDHMWEMHRQRKFKADCPLCGTAFRKFADLKKHVKYMHGHC